jgi:pimeloyl-ACP methyl ester carboxylesterase
MHLAIPHSELALIPAAGHASNVESPVVFNSLLAGFVSANIGG